nr:hypothetical protein [uncultured Cohaesibacter sp.]
MLFWNLFIQTLAIVIVVMLVGSGLSALARKKAASSKAKGE